MSDKESKKSNDLSKYPGVAIDIADDDNVNAKAVKQEIKLDNNNPRNNDM